MMGAASVDDGRGSLGHALPRSLVRRTDSQPILTMQLSGLGSYQLFESI